MFYALLLLVLETKIRPIFARAAQRGMPAFLHPAKPVTTEIVKDFPVENNDSLSLLAGKLVLESGDVLVLSANNSTDIKFLGSVLETLI